jgi:sugar phosphate isomerase/epimerase
MRLGIFAKTFPGATPDMVLEASAEAGYSVVQYNMASSGLEPMPDVIPDRTVTDIAAAVHRFGAEIVALSATYNMIHPDVAERARGHRRLDLLASVARALPTRLLTLCTGTRDPNDQWRGHPDNSTPEAWEDLLGSMQIAVAIAERHDVLLGIEPELANVVDSAHKAARLIEDIGSPRLVVVLDPANLFEQATPDDQHRIVAGAIERLAGRIAIGHAKDRSPTGEFATAGRGVLDYRFYLSCLRQAGFDGPLIAHGLAAAEAPAVAAFLRQAAADAGVGLQP